jgi:hypothetical protein
MIGFGIFELLATFQATIEFDFDMNYLTTDIEFF